MEYDLAGFASVLLTQGADVAAKFVLFPSFARSGNMKKKHTTVERPVSSRPAIPLEPLVEEVGERGDAFGDRIRQLRGAKAWSLEELAAASGVSRSMLSQIERSQANPTLAVTQRIARAFGLSLSSLVGEGEAHPVIEVVRSDDARAIYRSEAGCEIRTLSPLHLEKDIELYRLQLGPGRSLNSAAHFKGTRELVVVETGKVRITSGVTTELLSKGDTASYPADVPHAIENVSTGDARLVLLVSYQ